MKKDEIVISIGVKALVSKEEIDKALIAYAVEDTVEEDDGWIADDFETIQVNSSVNGIRFIIITEDDIIKVLLPEEYE